MSVCTMGLVRLGNISGSYVGSPWTFQLNCLSPKYESWLDQTGQACHRSVPKKVRLAIITKTAKIYAWISFTNEYVMS